MAPMTAAVIAIALSGAAVAQPTAPTIADPRLVRRSLATARELAQRAAAYAANHRPDDAAAELEDAAAAYRKAIDAGGEPGIYLELASVEERLGRFDEAVRHLRAAVGGPGLRADAVKRATARLAELSSRVGIVALTVLPAGTAITLGGVELGSSPLPEPLVLLPGTYALAFQADGFVAAEAEIAVEPGARIDRTIELAPVPVVAAPIAPASPPRPPPVHEAPPPRSRTPLIAGVAVTGAAVAGVAAFGLLAIHDHTTFTAAATSPADRADARTRGRRFAVAADVSLGVAAVAAAATAYWYFYRYRGVTRPDAGHAALIRPELDMVPWIQSQAGGVNFAGRF
jgi:hypothetical protein